MDLFGASKFYASLIGTVRGIAYLPGGTCTCFLVLFCCLVTNHIYFVFHFHSLIILGITAGVLTKYGITGRAVILLGTFMAVIGCLMACFAPNMETVIFAIGCFIGM